MNPGQAPPYTGVGSCCQLQAPTAGPPVGRLPRWLRESPAPLYKLTVRIICINGMLQRRDAVPCSVCSMMQHDILVVSFDDDCIPQVAFD